MKKQELLDLIGYALRGDTDKLIRKTEHLAQDFNKKGDEETALSIMRLVNEHRHIGEAGFNNHPFLTEVETDTPPLSLPQAVQDDIGGVLNALSRNCGVHKFLFIGSPGTGKTETVKYIARKLERKLVIVNFSVLVDSLLGQTAKNIAELFKMINQECFAREYIVVFDEIDAVALDRINQKDVREMGRVTSGFLKELDKINPNTWLFATTNLSDYLDKALIRRFDASICFDRYTVEEKVKVAQKLFEENLKEYGSILNINKNAPLLKKIIITADEVPNPGDLKNIIKTALVFSDPNDKNDYLKRFFGSVHGVQNVSRQYLKGKGFSDSQISLLETGE